jgi:CubicO group peptidase (beta-lactamase class C family)
MYSKCYGTQSVDLSSPLFDKPLSLDTTMWVASCTKLMTAIAALQCVEKGLLSLDDDISTVLPEWKERSVLVGFEGESADSKPILEKATGKMSLQMLLSHQSGLGYPFMRQDLQQFIDYERNRGTIKSELIVGRPSDPLVMCGAKDKLN